LLIFIYFCQTSCSNVP